MSSKFDNLVPNKPLSSVIANMVGNTTFQNIQTYSASVDGGSTWTTNLNYGRYNAITSTIGSAPIIRFNINLSGTDYASSMYQGIKGMCVSYI